MKRALLVATVGRFFGFLHSDIQLLKKHGYEVHCATNLHLSQRDGMEDFEESVVKHQIDFARNPFSKTNIRAYQQLRKLMNIYHFDMIHCHTPMGAMLGRFAAKKYRKYGTKIFYTAHGLHFYQGAPLKNWCIYFPVEYISSFWTDTLITINREDYARAKRYFHAKRVCYIPSIGIDIEKYADVQSFPKKKRIELGVSENEALIVSVGELSARKNQELVIRALGAMQLKHVKYMLIGEGEQQEKLKAEAQKYGISDAVYFLGHRKDIGEILKAADLFILPSFQEGVSMALLEAIACKTPVLCSDIRGSVDIIKDKELLFNPRDENELVDRLQQLCMKKDNGSLFIDRTYLNAHMKKFVEKYKKRLQAFDVKKVAMRMEHIYFD